MSTNHKNKWSSKRALKEYCNIHIYENKYFVDGYEKEIENHINHYAEFIHHKKYPVPVWRAEAALDKLLSEINTLIMKKRTINKFTIKNSCPRINFLSICLYKARLKI